MVVFMKANGKKARDQAMEYRYGKMEVFMKVFGKGTKPKG